jgi:hypothetical protein
MRNLPHDWLALAPFQSPPAQSSTPGSPG